ncbi:MAG: VWA domain-containing protein [Anaerolineaceae bacterium]|nr:VWA domain-containing protein [Anaerolineaceae bacterium]MBN2677928.1 VWA domain-containing protein [Anaerolineaceae bacterium]
MKKHPILQIIGLALIMSVVLASPVFTPTVHADQSEPEAKITQVDVSQFPLVTLYVSVTDEKGQPWAVNPDKINIYENDVLMEPIEISGEGEIGPLTSLLVMDISGSMNEAGKLEAARNAALAYIDLLNTGDQVGLMSFNTEVQYPQPLTTNLDSVRAAIQNLRAEKDTAFFDALVEAEKALADVSGRKAIVVLTDGLDNMSRSNLEDVLAGISETGLSISTVGLGEPDQQGLNSGLNENSLKMLANQAGGLYAYANDAETLKSIYQLYGYLLKSEYRITYQTPAELRDGIQRSLRVEIGETSAGIESGSSEYNPGGVIPEVDTSDAWRMFFILLAALAVFLLIPFIIRSVTSKAGGKAPSSKKNSKSKPITIKEPPRIKLK